MSHTIQVGLTANIDNYKKGMDDAKKSTSDTMGFIAGIVDRIKSLFAGMWDSLKSFFSNSSDKAKSSFGSMSDSASSAFTKIGSYFPGFHSDLDKTNDKMGQTEEKTSSLSQKIGIGLVAAFVAATAVIGGLTAKGLIAESAFAGIATSSDIAVSQLARFDGVAARSGTSIKDMGAAMVSFHDAMSKAAAGDGSDQFAKLGVNVADSNNALRQTDTVLIETAKKIAAMSSEAEKYAAASKVGFGGKEQVLEDIAHASELAASTTDEQAAAATRLGKIWHEILPGGKSMWAEISEKLTNSLTPAMTQASVAILEAKNKIVDAFNQIYGGGSLFDKMAIKIRDWSKDASQWFANVTKSVTDATISMAAYIAQKTGLGNDAPLKAPSAGYVPGQVKLASGKNSPVVTDADKEAQKQYDAMTKSIKDKIAAQQLEASTGAALTDGQRMAMQLMVGLRDGTVTLTDAQKKERTEQLNMLISQEQANKAMLDGKAEADAAAKKEAQAYASITSAIQAKIDEDKLQLSTNSALTDGQKLIIKLDNDIAHGKLKLAAANLASVKAKLVELGADEQLLKAQKAQQEITKYLQESVTARDQESASLQVEYAMYGKSTDARAIAMVAVNSEIWQKKELQKLEQEHLPITDQIRADLQAEAEARTKVGQSVLSQTQALQYAAQLTDENKRYAAAQIVDAQESAKALLQIDIDMWNERIRNAGDGTQAQKLLQQQYDIWYKNRQTDTAEWAGLQKSLQQYGREASDVGTQIGSAMTGAFQGAENAFANFVTTGKFGFADFAKSVVADLARIEAKMAISGIAKYLGTAIGDYFGAPSASVADVQFTPQTVDTSGFGLMSDIPHRANGGPVIGGMSYIVGERGEERFTPSGNGSITPNHALSSDSSGAVNIDITTNVNGGDTSTQASGGSASDARSMGDALNAKIKAVVAQETRQGGIIWKYQQGRA